MLRDNISGIMAHHAHPEISPHNHPLNEYMKFVVPGDLGGLMLSSARKLAKTGADFIICPDNTIHLAFSMVTFPGSI